MNRSDNHSNAASAASSDGELSRVAATRPRRLRRALATLALMLSVTSIVGVAPAGQASAATFTSVGSVCFKQGDGGPWMGPTTMQAWTRSGWVNMSSQGMTYTGCNSWVMPDNYYVRIVVDYTMGSTRWTSQSGYVYTRPYTRTSFGTYYVTVLWR